MWLVNFNFNLQNVTFLSDREAAPPERDINEEDTETAEFQTKLRQLGSNPSSTSTSTTQRDVVGVDQTSSCDATTPEVSAALSMDGKEDNDEEEKAAEIVRSRYFKLCLLL